MKQFYLVAMALLCFVPTLHAQRVRLPAQAVGNQPAAVKPSNETIVYPVRTGPASELAASLKYLYPNTPIVVALDVNSVLLIRVDADSKDEILGTLAKLDRPYRTIVVHAYLLRSHGVPLSADETAGLSGPRDEVLKRIEALRKGDQLSIENRIELTSIENQKAMVQVGQQRPIVSGSTITSSRTRVNNYQQIQTGTIFSVQARTATGDAIVMEIDFEKSQVQLPVAPSDDTASPPLGSVSTLVHQSTVQFADGDAVLAGTIVGKPTASSGHSYLVVTANMRHDAAKQPKVEPKPAPAKAKKPGRDPRYTAYFTKLLAKYDGDSDGKWNVDEWSKMSKDPGDADVDGDGFITVEELADWGMKR